MTITTQDLKGLKISTLRAIYKAARRECVAAKPGYNGNKGFDKFISYRASTPLDMTFSALCQVETIGDVSGFTAPSEETLNWGGFLGGEAYTIKGTGEAIARKILREVGA